MPIMMEKLAFAREGRDKNTRKNCTQRGLCGGVDAERRMLQTFFATVSRECHAEKMRSPRSESFNPCRCHYFTSGDFESSPVFDDVCTFQLQPAPKARVEPKQCRISFSASRCRSNQLCERVRRSCKEKATP